MAKALTKTVFYDEGPLRITFGDAGMFRLGVPKELPEHLANVLLRKGLVKEYIDVAVKRKKEVSNGPATR